MAKKIDFDGGKRASGVQVDTGGFKYEIVAKTEVLVAAAAVTPTGVWLSI